MKRIITLIIALALLAGGTNAYAFSTPVEVSGNAIWSWWTNPLATTDGDDLYFTGITEAGSQRVFKYNNGTTTYFTLGSAPQVDDHNAPALSKVPGRPTLVAYTGHGGPMKFRRDTSGGTNFGAESVLDFGGNTTYGQFLRDENRVILMSRAAGGWRYITSDDDGATWSSPQVFFDYTATGQGYALLRSFDSDPLTYHVAAYRNPVCCGNTSPNPIGYKTITFDDIWNGVGIGFELADLETVWDSPNNNTYRSRLLDVGDKHGLTILYYARWNETTPTPQYYYAVRQSDGSWISTKIISSGGPFHPHPRNYIGGIVLDRREGSERFYLALKEDGVWKMTTYRIASDGTPNTRVVLETDTLPLVRPVSVGNGVIYQQLTKYNSYTDYRAHVRYIEEVAP